MSERAVSLSEAIALQLKHFPRKNEEEFLAAVTDESTRDAVQAVLDETRTIHIEWGRKSLTDIGQEVRDHLRQRHPELSEAAVHRLGSYFTYLVK